MLLIDDIYTKEATNKSRFVCVRVCACVFFFLVFLYFFSSLYVSHASSPPYALKEEMNDESTKKYFQKNNINNKSNNKIKQRENWLVQWSTAIYDSSLHVLFSFFLSQIQILWLTCSIDFHLRHLNTIVISATIIPPLTRLTHNVTLMFRNFQASAGNNTSCWSSSHHLKRGLLDQYEIDTNQTSIRK